MPGWEAGRESYLDAYLDGVLFAKVGHHRLDLLRSRARETHRRSLANVPTEVWLVACDAKDDGATTSRSQRREREMDKRLGCKAGRMAEI
jgi:hypothetical protein